VELANLRGAGHDVELPRGRLASLLFDATRDAVEYLFDNSIGSLEQADDGVRVTFRSGAQRTFGLVVGADGLHSNVRGLTFGAEALRKLEDARARLRVKPDWRRDPPPACRQLLDKWLAKGS
jgi:2-polyprenyl-6-methoxyphenol hydroxylase-like FAD-dependent oxidoreductase